MKRVKHGRHDQLRANAINGPIPAIGRLERGDIGAAGFGDGDEIGAAPGEAALAELLDREVGGTVIGKN